MLTIGDVARLAGTTERAVRHYESVGLLPEPGRAPNGYRVYRASDVVRVHAVVRLRGVGLALEEIRGVLDGGPDAWRAALDQLTAQLAAEQAELDRRRDRLESLRARSADPVLPDGFGPVLDRLAAAGMPPESVEWSREAVLLVTVSDPDSLPDLLAHYESLLADPVRLRRHLDLDDRFEALADGGADEAEIEVLARDFLDQLRDSRLFDPDDDTRLTRSVDRLTKDLVASQSPAQQRLLSRVEALVHEERARRERDRARGQAPGDR